ncbi:MAG: type II secretion system protein [Patescibacteria group bacterium]|jgi:prepilin-type N-terminal cleavage/methylation domain-containing protein
MKNKKGFTLIELLVVIAIIGLLSTLAVVSLNSARVKSRDAKRVADVKQIQTALELFYSSRSSYPEADCDLGASGGCVCLDDAGFGSSTCSTAPVYMGLIPGGPSENEYYHYTGSDTSPQDYTITFTLEGKTGTLPAGNCTATSAGMTCAAL